MSFGDMITDKLFTGQREMTDLGIYHYGARFYSPTLGRFLSADTIVPGGANSQAYDRYAYVMNSPINLFDPTGNNPCDGKDSGFGMCDQITDDDLLGLLSWSFGWTTKGNFTERDLGIILDTGNVIANYMSSLTGKWGKGWIRSHLGNTVFKQNNITKYSAEKIGARAFVFPFKIVNLNPGKWDLEVIGHEFGHILDNNNQSGTSGLFPATFVGRGPADEMIIAMGGDPTLCNPRFLCLSNTFKPHGRKWYKENVAGLSPWSPSTAYGNAGVAEDFAEVFVLTILNPNLVPEARLSWMRNYLAPWR